jgi:hypothetical protein
MEVSGDCNLHRVLAGVEHARGQQGGAKLLSAWEVFWWGK